MAFRNSLIVYRKELKEALRDKRVIYSTIISPMLVIPLIWGVMGFFIAQRVTESNQETLKIGIINPQNSAAFASSLSGDKSLEISEVTDVKKGREEVLTRKLRAVVEIPADFQQNVDT